jgi:hypothetical protein
LIVEFPGSSEKEVAETLFALDFVLPFTPLTAASFFLGEGSPISKNPQKFGLTGVIQHPKNRQLFPPAILAGMEMLIKSYRGHRTAQRKLWKPVTDKVARWQAFHAKRNMHGTPALSCRDGGSFLIIRQEQRDGPCLHHRLHGTSRAIYLFCQQVRSYSELASRFPSITAQSLSFFLADLIAKRLLFQEADRVLALAIATS